MDLKFKRQEIKYQVETVNIQEQDAIYLVEIFVKDRLDDEAQEVFYSELEDKEINSQTVKEALYQAVLGNMSLIVLKNVIKEYEENPEKYKEKVKKFMENENK